MGDAVKLKRMGTLEEKQRQVVDISLAPMLRLALTCNMAIQYFLCKFPLRFLDMSHCFFVIGSEESGTGVLFWIS